MPKVVDHQKRRRELADAVLALAAREGVGSVTTRAVAEESGWSIGVINHYFDSRHDLLLAGLDRASELQQAAYRAILGNEETGPVRKLHELTECVLPLDDRRLALTRVFLFFYAEGTATESARERIAGQLAQWRGLVKNTIVDGIQAGEIPATLDADACTLHLTGLTDGLSLQAVLDPEVMTAIRHTRAVPQLLEALGLTSAVTT